MTVSFIDDDILDEKYVLRYYGFPYLPRVGDIVLPEVFMDTIDFNEYFDKEFVVSEVYWSKINGIIIATIEIAEIE